MSMLYIDVKMKWLCFTFLSAGIADFVIRFKNCMLLKYLQRRDNTFINGIFKQFREKLVYFQFNENFFGLNATEPSIPST